MIPLRDHNPSETYPLVTYVLIAANVLVFIYQLLLPTAELNNFLFQYSLTPRDLISGANLQNLITSIFLHGGFAHIIGNMLFLNIFGDNLEDQLGHLKYLFYYLACGIFGGFLQAIVNPTSTIPILGASGAIAGLMGGYLLLFPQHQIDILVPVFGFLQTATVPAYTMLIYWILFQVLGSFGSIGVAGGGTAYLAHLGGFILGIILIKIIRPVSKNRSWPPL